MLLERYLLLQKRFGDMHFDTNTNTSILVYIFHLIFSLLN